MIWRTRLLLVLAFAGFTLAASSAFAQSSICYAAPGGKDSNDGSYWGSAKADIMSCYDALPNAGGTIYVRDEGGKGNTIPACPPGDPPGCGIWIMGKNDPNFARPPAGWRRTKGTVEIVGFGNSITAGGIVPQAGVSAGGQDSSHPGIWLSDVTCHTFKNLKIYYGHNPIYLGFDSNGNAPPAEGVSAWAWKFENVAIFPNNYPGYGPAIKIGSNSVWGFFRDCQFNGNDREVATLQTLSRSGGTVTAKSNNSLPSSWTGTLNLGIVGAEDYSFNGLVAATVTGANTFTYSQKGSDATSKGGKASSDRAQIAVLNPGPGGGVGLIFFENSFFGGAGIRLYSGGASGLYVNTVYQENGYAPPVQVSGCPGGLGVQVFNIHSADRTSAIPGLRMDNISANCENSAVAELSMVDGPSYLGGSAGPTNRSVLPDTMGQSGITDGRVFAQTDTPRRAFGPVAARYPNLASQIPSTWAARGQCRGLAGVPSIAPDGTTNAGTLSIASGNTTACFYDDNKVLKGGDRIMGGGWIRSANGNGFSRESAMVFSCGDCKLENNQGYISPRSVRGGAGEWQWLSFSTRVESSGTYPVRLFGIADAKHPTVFFAPILIDIPSGSVSTNEAAEIALHLQSYRDDATAGQVSLLRGEQFKADSIQVGDGPTLTSGAGAPKGTGTVGCIYLRRDGVPGATFYIYEKDGWKAKF